MRYDFELLKDLCQELGMKWKLRGAEPHEIRGGADLLEVDLGNNAALCFVNAPAEDNCLVGMNAGGWHFHDQMEFTDKHGELRKLDYLDVLQGIATGTILICEFWTAGTIRDRRLLVKEEGLDLKYIQQGEEIRIRRHERSAR